MSNYHIENIRCVALVGHEAVGKTSLADALLFKAKAVDRRGCVEDGTSVSDYEEEERRQKHSIDSSVLYLDYEGKRVYLLDAPGKSDYLGQALGVLNAVDTALIVISATSGIQVNTRRMFSEAGKRGLARIFIINKLDGDNIDFQALLTNIRETFGKNCVLFDSPNAVGPNYTGSVSVLNPPTTPPPGCPVDLAKERALLVDAIIESDEALMEKYMSEGHVSSEELTTALPHELAEETIIPIFCTAAHKSKDVGVDELLEALVKYSPSPTYLPPHKGVQGTGDKLEEVTIKNTESGDFVAQVFKSLNDRFVGHMSYMRVYSGKLNGDQPLVNERTGKSTRSGGLLQVLGKATKPMAEAHAGDIVAVAKIDDLHIGDTVGSHANEPRLPMPAFPTPMFGLAVEPKTRGDEQKISECLQKIAEEDPTFKVTRDAQTKEMVITGMSQVHLDTVQKRLKSRYDLQIITHEPKIAYRETISGHAEASHRHKKQSGGRGQFGEVHLRVFSLPREITNTEQFFADFANKSRFEKLRLDHCHYDPEHNFGFIDTVVGGTIPNQFIPAVEKGCKELLERGALAGFRIQDVAVEVFFGKDHPVDSSEAAFKVAGRIAFKNAFLLAHPSLLEPIVDLEVTVPSRFTGAILSDLNTKRARIEDQDSLPGDLAVIKAKAPLSEVTRYAAQLGSITQGSGSYSIEFSHYDVVPGNVQQQIVSKAKVAHDEDE